MSISPCWDKKGAFQVLEEGEIETQRGGAPVFPSKTGVARGRGTREFSAGSGRPFRWGSTNLLQGCEGAKRGGKRVAEGGGVA